MQPISSKSQSKELRNNILLLLFTLLISFIIIEIMLALFFSPVYGFKKGVFAKDETIGYKLSSNYEGNQSVYGRIYELKTNSLGLRDSREYIYKKKENTTRIVILGDSFAFGNGVNLEETYAEYLREMFGNQGVEVINLGVPGYGINNQFLSFIKYGSKYSPDIILINYVTNDWNTHQLLINSSGSYFADPNHTLSVDDEGLLSSGNDKRFSLRTIHLTILYHSRTYSFFYSKLRSFISPLMYKYWRSPPSYFLDNSSTEYQEAYEGYYSILNVLKNSTNASIFILIGPFKEDLISSERIQKQFYLNYSVSSTQTQESVEEIAQKLGIKVIRVKSEDPEIFLRLDGHWNNEGHKLVAYASYLELNRSINDKLEQLRSNKTLPKKIILTSRNTSKKKVLLSNKITN